jgi:hypothetical protein
MSNAKKAGTLAKIITLACAAYLPQAYADQVYDFGLINAPTQVDLIDDSIPTGSFTDIFKFNISSGANVGSAAVSFTLTDDTNQPNQFGAQLTSISLNDGTGATVIKQGDIKAFDSVYDSDSGFYTYKFTGTVNSTALTAGSYYSIVISGNGGDNNGPWYDGDGNLIASAPGNYTGKLTLTLPGVPAPEPEQWAMMMLGLPMIGWISRKKQNSLRTATPA